MKTNNNRYKIFGERLDAVMVQRNITNLDLAEKMYVSPTTISGYRNGKRSPSVMELAALARLLRVSADLLIGNTSSANIETDLAGGK